MRNLGVIKLLRDQPSPGNVVTDTHALTPLETNGLTAIRQELRGMAF